MEEHDKELIVEATGSPFCREIHEAKLPEGFTLPTIKAYEGKSDPQDYLDHFNNLMELHLISDMAKCRVFAVTLASRAKKWLKSITPRLIVSLQQLSTSFLQQFQATKQFIIPLAHLGNVKQRKSESLKSYLNRFTVKSAHVR